MPNVSRRWQARIEVGEFEDGDWEKELPYQSFFVYGETIEALRASARAYLISRKPSCFSNVGDHIAGKIIYFDAAVEDMLFDAKTLEKGWWYQELDIVGGQLQNSLSSPAQRLKGFTAAIEHFLEFALIPEKGPDFRSVAIIDKKLQLPLLEKVLRERDEYPVNDLIQRGWHIIALEYKGELSMTGELTNRKAVFVMGHPERQAALYTIESEYYRKSHSRLE